MVSGEEVGRQMEPVKLKQKNEELYAASLHLLSKSVLPLIAGNGEMYSEIRSFRLIPCSQLQVMRPSLSTLPILDWSWYWSLASIFSCKSDDLFKTSPEKNTLLQTRLGGTPSILLAGSESVSWNTRYCHTSIRVTLQIQECLQVVTQATEKASSTQRRQWKTLINAKFWPSPSLL